MYIWDFCFEKSANMQRIQYKKLRPIKFFIIKLGFNKLGKKASAL